MITSRQNEFVKHVRSLKDKKNRDIFGEYVAEGIRSVTDAVSAGAEVVAIAVVPDLYEKVKGLAPRCETVSEEVFGAISEEVTPQGVIAVIKKPKESAVAQGKCLFLDGVSDPANVGAAIRSAAAFGFNSVFIGSGADPYSGKAVRASMGGIFRVKIFTGESKELLDKIAVPIVCADMNGESVVTATIPQEFCLVIGNEAHGVSENAKACAAKTLAIPMQNGMESLNAAVSAGIIMFATTYINRKE